ncbi:MAG: lysine 2,3-aminomutase [bacterium]|jgi:lysine 2,3-aminomutase
MNSSSLQFQKRFFPNITTQEWNDWKWQLRNRIKTFDELARVFSLSKDEIQAVSEHQDKLPIAITPYYASQLHFHDPEQQLRKTVIPRPEEFLVSEGELIDPLGEDDLSPVRSIVHRYPDRVLFLVTQNCAVYCRYCTRSRLVGKTEERFSRSNWKEAIQYIKETPAIRDVLISGGDPLFLDDQWIEWLLQELRSIPHVEIIRIGTKVPMVLPQRITDNLLNIIKKYHPVYFSVHVTHPNELSPESRNACEKIANAGIPMGSQTVLLKGVNDSVEIIRSLMQKLLYCRVRPYALYQCDPVYGSSHFRVPIEQGLEILQGLRGHTSGYAVPHYIIDPPGGTGKIALTPDAILKRTEKGYHFKNWQGKEVFYYDPISDKSNFSDDSLA